MLHSLVALGARSASLGRAVNERGATLGLPQRIRVEANRVTPGRSRALSLVSPPQTGPAGPGRTAVGRAVRGSLRASDCSHSRPGCFVPVFFPAWPVRLKIKEKRINKTCISCKRKVIEGLPNLLEYLCW